MALLNSTGRKVWTITNEESLQMMQDVLQSDLRVIALIMGIAIAALGPVIAVSNAIIIAAILKDPFKQLRSSPSNIIIASMASCDFLVGTVCSTVQSTWYLCLYNNVHISRSLIQTAFGVGVFLIGVSMFHVLALTTDRAIAVANPLLYKSRVTKFRVTMSIVCIWGIFPLIGICLVVLHDYYFYLNVTAMSVLHLVVVVVSFLSLFIVFQVRKQTKELKKNIELTANMKSVLERDRKTTKSILLISTVFEACFVPLFISFTVLMTCSSCYSHLVVVIVFYYFSFVLTHVNSCLNPFLYAFRLPKFRKPVAIVARTLFFCFKSSRVNNTNALELANLPTSTLHVNKNTKAGDHSASNNKL